MSFGFGFGLRLGAQQYRSRRRPQTAQEQLYEPETNPLLDRASLWCPDVSAELFQQFARDPNRLYQLSPREFEQLIASIMHNHGFEVHLTPETNDGGYDVMAVRRDDITGQAVYLVECKRYSQQHRVGVGIVRSLYGVLENQAATKGIVATTSFFTKGAKTFEETNYNRLSLRDYDDIVTWLHRLT